MDRDYCAGLELGTRRGRGIKKSKIVDRDKKKQRTLIAGKTRDKHHSTPKRPRVIRRKTTYKLIKKQKADMTDFNNNSGVSITVASSGIVSMNALCLPVFTGSNVFNKVL